MEKFEVLKGINISTIVMLIFTCILSIVTVVCFVECIIVQREPTIQISNMKEETEQVENMVENN